MKRNPNQLLHAVAALERITPLRVCLNFSPAFPWPGAGADDWLDWAHRAHRTRFCEVVKANKKMRSCGGHDGVKMVALAGRRREPFVHICHAGVAEVIAPIRLQGEHVATVFCGQAVTEPVARAGFEGVRRRVEPLGVDLDALRAAYDELPVLSTARMRAIGEIAQTVVTHTLESMSDAALERASLLRQHPGMERAVAYVRERCDEDLRSEEAARVAGVSAGHFCRLFRRLVGMTFKQYLTELRIRRAQQLLVDTSLKVIEIGLLVGYSRHSYFTRRFREIVGVTPNQFRTRLRREWASSDDGRNDAPRGYRSTRRRQ